VFSLLFYLAHSQMYFAVRLINHYFMKAYEGV